MLVIVSHIVKPDASTDDDKTKTNQVMNRKVSLGSMAGGFVYLIGFFLTSTHFDKSKITENFLPKQTMDKILAKCRFSIEYLDYESKKKMPYNCDSENVDVLESSLCIFHEERYLEGYFFHDDFGAKEVSNFTDTLELRTQRVTKRLKEKINDSIVNQKALFCIGYHFPDNITIKGDFTKPVYFFKATLRWIDFSLAKFSAQADFHSAEFSRGADFGSAEFSEQANFDSAKFLGRAYFDSAKFAQANFRSAKFSAQADFDSAKFSAQANFRSAKFSKEAYFGSAKFSKEAYFGSAKFSKEAYFGSVKFSEK